MKPPSPYAAVVVGGGFFGCNVALHLRRRAERVLLIERSAELLSGASYNNQARVHGGYHYPRSITTGLRSRANYEPFLKEFDGCIVHSFRKYYAISRQSSWVSARQFVTYCRRIGAPLMEAPATVRKLFHPDLIEAVFEVEECAFDATRLRDLLRDRLASAGIEVRLKTGVARIFAAPGSGLQVEIDRPEGDVVSGDRVFLCTYSKMNSLLADSRLPLMPLRHELAEIALVEVPEPLASIGVTVMCGPFFSVMPCPPAPRHSLSHVRYTPHFAWNEGAQPDGATAAALIDPATPFADSHFLRMRKDAERYLPLMRECRHVRSLWETKTLLPRNDNDDGRPILFVRDHGLKNLTCVLGGKLDNVFDVFAEMDAWEMAA